MRGGTRIANDKRGRGSISPCMAPVSGYGMEVHRVARRASLAHRSPQGSPHMRFIIFFGLVAIVAAAAALAFLGSTP